MKKNIDEHVISGGVELEEETNEENAEIERNKEVSTQTSLLPTSPFSSSTSSGSRSSASPRRQEA